MWVRRIYAPAQATLILRTVWRQNEERWPRVDRSSEKIAKFGNSAKNRKMTEHDENVVTDSRLIWVVLFISRRCQWSDSYTYVSSHTSRSRCSRSTPDHLTAFRYLVRCRLLGLLSPADAYNRRRILIAGRRWQRAAASARTVMSRNSTVLQPGPSTARRQARPGHSDVFAAIDYLFQRFVRLQHVLFIRPVIARRVLRRG